MAGTMTSPIRDFDDWARRLARHVKLRHLHTLLVVARAGSMGRAADLLAISQPVISKSIAELEDAVGQRLLDRSVAGVAPTIYGKALLARAATVFDELQRGMRELEHLADPSTGDVHIGCTEAAALGFVPAIIDRLSRQYPRIIVRVITADAVSLVQRELRQRRIDVVFAAAPSDPTGDDVDVELLFEDRHVVMAGGRNKWLRRRGLALSELAGEPWILPPPDSDSGRRIGRAFRARDVELPASALVAQSIPLCQALLMRGRYLAVLPATIVRLAREPSIRIVDVDLPAIVRPVCVMTLRNRTPSPTTKLFIEAARETARAWIQTRAGSVHAPAVRWPSSR